MCDEAEYKLKLLEAMQSCNQTAIQNIKGAIANWPEKADVFSFDTFIDQDAEGFVSVLITPDGPDTYALCKAIEDFRYLFEVKFEDGKLNYSLPMFDPNEEKFDVGNAVSETALEWVTYLIGQVGKASFPAPVRFSNCDHETKLLF